MINKKKQFSIFGFKLKSELSEISLVNFFTNIAHGLVGVFVPIYIYQNTQFGISGVFAYFIMRRVLIVLLSLLAGELISRKGIRPSVTIGGFLSILYFLSLPLMVQSAWFLILVCILDSSKGAFTWIAGNTDLAISLDDLHSGSEMAKLNFVSTLAKIISPVIGGLVITKFGYDSLYFVASFFAFIYFILTFLLGEDYYEYNFPSRKVLRGTLDGVRKSPITQLNILDGVRGIIAGTVWPLLIFLILPDIESIGWLSTLTLLTMTSFSFYVAKIVDNNPKAAEKMASRGIVSESMSWVGKLGAFNFYTLFATDMFTQVSNGFFSASMEKMNFGSRSKVKNALENITEREIAISLGQIFMSSIGFLLSIFMNDIWTLRATIITFGFVSLLIGVVSPQKNKKLKAIQTY